MNLDKMREKAAKAALLHETSIPFELDRIARENGYPTWAELTAVLPVRVIDDMAFREQWNLATELRPEVLRDQRFVPAYNPLAPGRLPASGQECDHHVETICRILLGRAAETDEPAGMEILEGETLAGLIHDAIGDAEGVGETPSLASARKIVDTMVRDVYTFRQANPRSEADHWVEVLRRRADRHGLHPLSVRVYLGLADVGVGLRSAMLGKAVEGLVVFRNADIARLAG